MIQDTLTGYGALGVQLLKDSVRKVSATGKTEQSIRFVVEKTANGYSLTIYGRSYFSALETGRGPRRSNTYGMFDVSLDEYLQAKGVATKTSKKGLKYYKLGNSWVTAKGLAHKINTQGDRLWQKGKGEPVRDVYSSTLSKFVDELTKQVVKDYSKFYIKTIKDGFKLTTTT